MDSLRTKEINPVILVPIVVVIVLAGIYFLWLGPKMKADAALRDFNTPEAQARRDPDQRKTSPTLRKTLDEYLAKEGHAGKSGRRSHE